MLIPSVARPLDFVESTALSSTARPESAFSPLNTSRYSSPRVKALRMSPCEISSPYSWNMLPALATSTFSFVTRCVPYHHLPTMYGSSTPSSPAYASSTYLPWPSVTMNLGSAMPMLKLCLPSGCPYWM